MTYEEAMARLRAVDPLPVGERLARWFSAKSDPISLHFRSRVLAYARPLRIARERSKMFRYWYLQFDAAAKENERLRAALDAALDECTIVGWRYGDALSQDSEEFIKWKARIRDIADGRS